MSGTPIQNTINTSPMSRAQVLAVGICLLLNTIDGFDIMIMSFTAVPVGNEWGLDNSTLGVLLSAGLFGMAGGALFLAQYADVIGRRKMILICTTIMGFGMLFSGYVTSHEQLAILRFITGIGIGGMIASLNTIVSEYSSDKKRGFAVSLIQTGNPIGGILGGIASVYLISEFGWRSAFIFGGIITLVLIPVIMWKLPESISFLESSRPKNALEKINKILSSYGHKPVDELPEPVKNEVRQTGLKSLFSDGRMQTSILLASAFFISLFSFYFVMSWTPKLLVQAGLSTSAGISGAVFLNIGGIIGSLILGYISSKRNLQKIIGMYMFATTVLMVVFGMVTANFIPALMVGLMLGFFMFGGIIGLYALGPIVYPVENRAAGIGFAIGVGRFGAVVAPVAAGFMLDRDLSIPVMFALFAAPMLICMIAQSKIKVLDS